MFSVLRPERTSSQPCAPCSPPEHTALHTPPSALRTPLSALRSSIVLCARPTQCLVTSEKCLQWSPFCMLDSRCLVSMVSPGRGVLGGRGLGLHDPDLSMLCGPMWSVTKLFISNVFPFQYSSQNIHTKECNIDKK